MSQFVSDIKAIRDRARKHIENGAVTASYGVDRELAVKLLNEALATELVCVLRYTSHAENADGIHAEGVVAEFKEHASEEQGHANQIAERIGQLQGKPDYNPATLLQRSHAEFVQPDTLVEMIKENLVAERIAIESYSDMIRFFGDKDPTTRRMLEEILAKEEEHADDMQKLLANVGENKH